jgi:hypothetical protein
MKHTNKHTFVIFIALLSGCMQLYGQRHEMGLFGGYSYYMGDINPKKHFAMSKIAFGGVYRYNINPHWALKFNMYRGTVESSDAVIKFNQNRNLSFRSPLTEFALQLELNFFEYVTGSHSMIVSPFIYAGIAHFHFNPQAEHNGVWYNLQPLGTEGQGTTAYPERSPYNLSGFAIPFGIGGKFSVSKMVCIGVEWGMRKTFTDYLDDVSTTYPDPVMLAAENSPIASILSDRTIYPVGEEPLSNTGMQRGDSSTNDWYSFAGITITFRVFPKREVCHKGHRSKKVYKYKYD